MPSVPMKITCGDDLRRVALPSEISFAQLSQTLSEMFNLESLETFAIKYTDDEGDLVTVTDDNELSVMLAGHATGGQPPLRIEIFCCQKSPNGKGMPRPRRLRDEAVLAAAPAQTEAPVETASIEGLGTEGMGDIEALAHELATGHPTMQFGFGPRHGGRHHGGRHHHGHHGFRGPGHGGGRGWGRHSGGGGGRGRGGPCGGGFGGGCGPKSRFVSDITLADGSIVEPATETTKIWKMANQGSMAWPEGTTLLHVAGDALLAEPGTPIPVAPCEPGAEVEISADLLAPSAPGRYISYFRLQGPRGHRFGQRIWVMLLVSADGSGDDLSSDDFAEHGGRGRGMPQEQRRAHRIEMMRAKSEQFAAKAAEIKASMTATQDSTSAGHRHQHHEQKALQKIARLEAKSAMFKQKLAALQLGTDAVASLSPAQQQALLDKHANLSAEQITAVCSAVAEGRHLGIVCDVTGQMPIIGTRFTKPAAGQEGETYDICEAAYAELGHEEQESFEAVPSPDIEIVIRTILSGNSQAVVVATEEAIPPQEQEPVKSGAAASDDGGFELVSGDSVDGSFTTATAAAAVAKDEAVAAVELEGAMEQLQAMGFDTAENPQVVEALRLSDGNVQGALEALLAQQSA